VLVDAWLGNSIKLTRPMQVSDGKDDARSRRRASSEQVDVKHGSGTVLAGKKD
jgi:hypothetical protein